MKRRVNLNEITAKEPMRVDTEIQSSLVDLPPEEVSKASPFKLKVEITKKPVGYQVKGRVTGEVELTCSRCLKKFTHKIDKEFDYKLMPTSQIGGGQIKSGELDIKFSDESILDLAEVVQEQVMLELPVKPLCGDRCSQVSYVEEELQEEEAGEKEIDSRWEKLKELQNKLKGKE